MVEPSSVGLIRSIAPNLLSDPHSISRGQIFSTAVANKSRDRLDDWGDTDHKPY